MVRSSLPFPLPKVRNVHRPLTWHESSTPRVTANLSARGVDVPCFFSGCGGHVIPAAVVFAISTAQCLSWTVAVFGTATHENCPWRPTLGCNTQYSTFRPRRARTLGSFPPTLHRNNKCNAEGVRGDGGNRTTKQSTHEGLQKCQTQQYTYPGGGG